MRFKEFLLEMAIKIADIQTTGRKISIQIRTNNVSVQGVQPGQGEHYPAHLHIVNFGARLNVPIEIKTGKILSDNHHIEGKLSKKEIAEIKWFLDYYGRNELSELFDKAMKGEDPSTLFDKLRREKDNEHRNQNIDS